MYVPNAPLIYAERMAFKLWPSVWLFLVSTYLIDPTKAKERCYPAKIANGFVAAFVFQTSRPPKACLIFFVTSQTNNPFAAA